MYDNLTEEKVNKEYRQVCLENEYVKVCVLPELGGRIFEAKDKTNGYDFFYKQSVIKPALIGMTGAWISGGVEWNIPHHHRASSFLPVRVKTEEHADGARTIWIGEMELRDRMRWAVGLTLRPRSSVLEAQITALNTSPFANSLLYFANVAVHANENYQILFPPRTRFATQHAKREFIEWPLGRQVYNGIDYTRGVDLTWWKNHPSPVSMFAWNGTDDFLAAVRVPHVDRALHHHAPVRALAEVAGQAHEQRRRVCPLGEADARHVEFRPVVRLDADSVRLEARWQRRLVLLHLILLVYRDPTSGW